MSAEILLSPDINLAEIKEKVRDIPVCLIIPPSTFLADERVFPFLGPLKVAAELEANGNYVEVLDLSGFGNYEEIVRTYVENSHIRIFGLTATTPQIPAAAKVATIIREVSPDSKIILGGPHVTLAHTAMREDHKAGRNGRGTAVFNQLENLFDSLVVGDGEMAIFPAINPHNKTQVIDAGHLKSPLFMNRGTLDNYHYPARHLIDRDSYHYQIDGQPAFSVIAQLGCPFECGFCGGRDSAFFRVTRTRTVENVISEIEQEVNESIKRGHPLSGVMFYDDELNVVPQGLENLCHQLISIQERLGIKMRFRGFVKAELFTPQQAELMYQAGFRMLLSGVESGSDKMLGAMKKHTSRAINTRCVEFAHQAGLRFKSLMSMGHPSESEETVSQSVEWVLSNLTADFDDVDWTIITQYPGTLYFDKSVYVPEKNAWVYQVMVGGKPERLWSRSVDYATQAHYFKGVPGNYEAYVWTDHLSPEDLVKLRDEAEKITRNYLKLPLITSVAARQFEHSMGQKLPPHILRQSGVIYQAH